ncbi:MAG: iron(III) transport system ATP-binding protein [Actinomycetota bacterium]|nr:iron(III) transport system ATP-binding protein [Actinomycetota bacterium]
MTVLDRNSSHPRADVMPEGVSLQEVKKKYGAVEALRGIDLTIPPGTFTVLLGPSGSGKSTLLRGIAGIERFDSGIVRFGDRLISDGTHFVQPEHRGLSMVFQDYALWPHLTVEQNVSYALRRRRLSTGAAQDKVIQTIDRVGLEGLAPRYPHELSGGQQQRVALARAMVGDPALILFDEPLSNLDADLRERMRTEISTLVRASGATAVYITHDQSEAFALADLIGVLDRGALVQLGTPEQIYWRPASPFAARFTGLGGTFSGILVSVSDGIATVRVGEHILHCVAPVEVPASKRVEVLMRPTATRIAPLELHRDESLIPATVVDIAYRGRRYEHVVDSAHGRIAKIISREPWARGTQVRLQIDPSECISFASSASEHF